MRIVTQFVHFGSFVYKYTIAVFHAWGTIVRTVIDVKRITG